MNVKEAEKIAHKLSHPSKMPGPAYSLPAKNCKIGSILAQVSGTTCFSCYALKGRYVFPNVQNALARRLQSITDPRWVEAMVTMIKSSKTKWFRWHDSGDLQSTEHLGKIVEIAKQLPTVNFWLPTREYDIVREYVLTHNLPGNLTARLSSHKVDQDPPSGYGYVTSTVHTKGSKIIGEECKAYTRENKCGTCRACWDPKVANISYPKH